MRVRVLDLDGSVTMQHKLLHAQQPEVLSFRGWGPRLRLACRWGRFQRFERALKRRLPWPGPREPYLTFIGSGDFHHVSLALLRQQREPFNLLVLDKHPDWMWGVPVLHCGTWLLHAAHLPTVKRVFHLGGEVDFDNGYRWLAPWSMIRSGIRMLIPNGSAAFTRVGFFSSPATNQAAPIA